MPEGARESQRGPERVRESQSEPDSDPERARESQRVAPLKTSDRYGIIGSSNLTWGRAQCASHMPALYAAFYRWAREAKEEQAEG